MDLGQERLKDLAEQQDLATNSRCSYKPWKERSKGQAMQQKIFLVKLQSRGLHVTGSSGASLAEQLVFHNAPRWEERSRKHGAKSVRVGGKMPQSWQAFLFRRQGVSTSVRTPRWDEMRSKLGTKSARMAERTKAAYSAHSAL